MSTIVTLVQGGTGSNTAADARLTLGVSSSNVTNASYAQANAAYAQANAAFNAANSAFIGNTYSQLVGDGSNTVYTITHNLNRTSQIVQVRRVSSGAMVYPDISIVSANVANLTFSITPTSNEYRVSIIGF